jgi:hypothetical protein
VRERDWVYCNHLKVCLGNKNYQIRNHTHVRAYAPQKEFGARCGRVPVNTCSRTYHTWHCMHSQRSLTPHHTPTTRVLGATWSFQWHTPAQGGAHAEPRPNTPLSRVGGHQRPPCHPHTMPDTVCTLTNHTSCTNNTRFGSNMVISVAYTSTGGCTCRAATEHPIVRCGWVGTRDHLVTHIPYLTLHAQPNAHQYHTTHQAPSTEHRAPSTEHQAPSTKHRAPSTEHRAPSTEHRAPSTEHQAPSTIGKPMWCNL